MSFNDLFSGGGRSAFNKDSVIGETVTGPIITATQRQMTDYVTKAPETWDDGQPKMQAVVTIKTSQTTDPTDDGARTVYIKAWGLDKQALVQAVQDAGYGADANAALAAGNIFTATFSGTQPSKYGSDQKIYTYKIQKGADLPAMTAPEPQAAPAAAAPVAAEPAAAPTAAPAAPTAAPVDPQALIKAGLDDAAIAAATGLDAGVITILRQQTQA